MPILDVYGLSETSGAHAFASFDTPNVDSVGRTLQGFKTKIVHPDENGYGEVCIKGRHVFMGYLNDDQRTFEAFDDHRWFHTGDVGYIDDAGNIFITGRIKELVITAGGENIAPVAIENLVKTECIAISNAFLVGDRRKFLSLLVTLKTKTSSDGAPLDELLPETMKWLEKLNLNYKTLTEVLAAGPDKKVVQAIQDAIDSANDKAVSNAQKVQKFAILPHDFSIPTGEFGPTMKVKRNEVLEMYREIIDKFYS